MIADTITVIKQLSVRKIGLIKDIKHIKHISNKVASEWKLNVSDSNKFASEWKHKVDGFNKGVSERIFSA